MEIKNDIYGVAYIFYNPSNGLSKIGMTSRLYHRFNGIRTQGGIVDLEAYYYTPPIYHYELMEYDCQEYFKDSHVIGEWFNCDREQLYQFMIDKLATNEDRYIISPIFKEYIRDDKLITIANRYNISRQYLYDLLRNWGLLKKDNLNSSKLMLSILDDYYKGNVNNVILDSAIRIPSEKKETNKDVAKKATINPIIIQEPIIEVQEPKVFKLKRRDKEGNLVDEDGNILEYAKPKGYSLSKEIPRVD